MAGQAALQQSQAGSSNLAPLEKFQVYCTRGFHYIVGSDKAESAFRVLKLSRHGGPELEAFEDATIYSKTQCSALLSQIHAGNLLHKGLQLVCEVGTILSRILSAACARPVPHKSPAIHRRLTGCNGSRITAAQDLPQQPPAASCQLMLQLAQKVA